MNTQKNIRNEKARNCFQNLFYIILNTYLLVRPYLCIQIQWKICWHLHKNKSAHYEYKFVLINLFVPVVTFLWTITYFSDGSSTSFPFSGYLLEHLGHRLLTRRRLLLLVVVRGLEIIKVTSGDEWLCHMRRTSILVLIDSRSESGSLNKISHWRLWMKCKILQTKTHTSQRSDWGRKISHWKKFLYQQWDPSSSKPDLALVTKCQN